MNRRAVDSDGRPGVDEKFSRRPARARLTALAMFVMAFVGLVAPGSHPAVATATPPDTVDVTVQVTVAPPTTAPLVTRPPISANEFIPDEQDLTSCIGVLERPGCGSESRGGSGQTLVFVAVCFGLLFVFGNITRGVMKNRQAQDDRP